MFSDYDTFRLTKPIADASVPVGTVGVVLMVYNSPSLAYEVEFPDGKGSNLGELATFTLTEDFMEVCD